MTTTRLHLPRRPLSPWLPFVASLSVFLLLGLASAAARWASAPIERVLPTPALAIVFATSAPQALIIATPLPTAVPAPTATPDGALLAELEQLRARVAQLEQQQAAPSVVYQVISAPVEAAPTIEPEQYQVMQQPPELAPQQMVLLDRNAWAAQAQQAKEQR